MVYSRCYHLHWTRSGIVPTWLSYPVFRCSKWK